MHFKRKKWPVNLGKVAQALDKTNSIGLEMVLIPAGSFMERGTMEDY